MIEGAVTWIVPAHVTAPERTSKAAEELLPRFSVPLFEVKSPTPPGLICREPVLETI
jgi:hypothetical protein